MAWTKRLDTATARRFEPARVATGLLRLALLWRHRMRSRRALHDLDARLLCDIGIDRLDAAAEARKPFWRG